MFITFFVITLFPNNINSTYSASIWPNLKCNYSNDLAKAIGLNNSFTTHTIDKNAFIHQISKQNKIVLPAALLHKKYCKTMLTSNDINTTLAILNNLQQDNQPQELPLVTCYINDKKLKLSIARSLFERTKGLMFRDNLDENEGMLFVFEKPQILKFWMKNTKIPLDLIFLNENFVVIEIIENMKPGYGIEDQNLPVYSSTKPAKYALELPAGSIKKFKIIVGSKLIVPYTLNLENNSH